MATHPQHSVVWVEIPVRDLSRAVDFYNAVLDQDMAPMMMGPNEVAIINPQSTETGIAGHLYEGEPVEGGPTIHLMAPDSLEATRARVIAAGGKVESDPIPMPFGAYFYARDLDGNSIGLFRPPA